MPRPEKITEATRKRRLCERRQQDACDDALLRQITVDELPHRMRASANSPGKPRRLPFEKEACDLALLLEDYLGVNPTHDLAQELAWSLVNTKAEWQRQSRTNAVQPTVGKMNVTIESGAKYARKLREWSNALPAALLHDVKVLIPGDPPLRAVIEHLAHTFDLLCEVYPRPIGRPPGRRDAAQWVAAPLMLFVYRHAPDATEQQQRIFVRECLRLVGIECPDPDEHSTKFARWFGPVETAAKRALAHSHVRSRARALAQSALPE